MPEETAVEQKMEALNVKDNGAAASKKQEKKKNNAGNKAAANARPLEALNTTTCGLIA